VAAHVTLTRCPHAEDLTSVLGVGASNRSARARSRRRRSADRDVV